MLFFARTSQNSFHSSVKFLLYEFHISQSFSNSWLSWITKLLFQAFLWWKILWKRLLLHLGRHFIRILPQFTAAESNIHTVFVQLFRPKSLPRREIQHMAKITTADSWCSPVSKNSSEESNIHSLLSHSYGEQWLYVVLDELPSKNALSQNVYSCVVHMHALYQQKMNVGTHIPHSSQTASTLIFSPLQHFSMKQFSEYLLTITEQIRSFACILISSCLHLLLRNIGMPFFH